MSARPCALGCLVLALMGACATSDGQRGPSSSAADSGAIRRAWVGWRSEPQGSLVRACGSGATDPVPGIGHAGCWRGGPGGPLKMSDDGFVRDTRPADRVPGGRCRIVYEDSVDGRTPARAWLESAAGRELLDEWQPEGASRDQGLAIEVSYSPDAKWMALAHLRTKGDGELEVDDVNVVSARACP